jgi:hypothetical protein
MGSNSFFSTALHELHKETKNQSKSINNLQIIENKSRYHFFENLRSLLFSSYTFLNIKPEFFLVYKNFYFWRFFLLFNFLNLNWNPSFSKKKINKRRWTITTWKFLSIKSVFFLKYFYCIMCWKNIKTVFFKIGIRRYKCLD